MIHQFRVIWGCQPDAVHKENEPYSKDKYRKMIYDFNLPEVVEFEIANPHEYDAGQIIDLIESSFNWKVAGIRFLKLIK